MSQLFLVTKFHFPSNSLLGFHTIFLIFYCVLDRNCSTFNYYIHIIWFDLLNKIVTKKVMDPVIRRGMFVFNHTNLNWILENLLLNRVWRVLEIDKSYFTMIYVFVWVCGWKRERIRETKWGKAERRTL